MVLRGIFFITLIITIYSCSSAIKGPNYNSSSSHNKTLKDRRSIIIKEDSRMKKSMIKHRKKYSRAIKYTRAKESSKKLKIR
jgi:hypothetical protein